MNYLGLSVFPLAVHLDNPPDYQIGFDPRRVQLGFGHSPAAPTQAWAKRTLTAICPATHAERREVEAWAKSLRGRQGAFWLPCLHSFGDVISSSAGQVVIEDQNFHEEFLAAPAVHAYVSRVDGTEEAREIDSTAQAGDEETFTFDSDLSAPLGPQDLLCRLYLVRLAEAKLDWDIDGPICTLTLTAVEKPNDYAAIPTLPDTLPVWLYRIVKRVSRTELYSVTLTSAPLDATYDGETWQRAPIDHRGLTLHSQGDKDKCELGLYDYDGNPFSGWDPRHWDWPVEVYVLYGEADPDTGALTASPTIIFRGDVEKVAKVGDVRTVSLRSMLARESRVPRFQIQTSCNHILFDTSTCRAVAASYQIDGSIEGLDADTPSVDIEAAALDGKAANWLSKGWIVVGSGIDAEIRGINAVEALTSTRHRVTLNIPLITAELTDDISVWPGCDRTPTGCAKFDNFVNYGGAPFVPADNPAIKAIELVEQDTEGGKK